MMRMACAVLVLVTYAAAAHAQTPAARHKSPAEIAAASEALAIKREACRLRAQEQKLTFGKRRKFIRDCVTR
jgi:hypothetical protein